MQIRTLRFPTMKSPSPMIHGINVCSEKITNVWFFVHWSVPKKRRVSRNSLAYLYCTKRNHILFSLNVISFSINHAHRSSVCILTKLPVFWENWHHKWKRNKPSTVQISVSEWRVKSIEIIWTV